MTSALLLNDKIITNPDDPPIFQYCKPKFPDDCYHNISPSCIDEFFSYPVLYYKERVLENEPKFKGSTSTVLGSICHKIYESVAKKEIITKEIIDKQLNQFDENDIEVVHEKLLQGRRTGPLWGNGLLRSSVPGGSLPDPAQGDGGRLRDLADCK